MSSEVISWLLSDNGAGDTGRELSAAEVAAWVVDCTAPAAEATSPDRFAAAVTEFFQESENDRQRS